MIARLKEFMTDTSNRGRVLFILMTNRPDKLDVDIKRAGRLDRKIPFLYAQTAEEVEVVLGAQLRKHKLDRARVPARPRRGLAADRRLLQRRLRGGGAAGRRHAAERRRRARRSTTAHFVQAIADYLPPRDVEMLEYMELLAVFEASSRRMLPQKYAGISMEELQRRLAELKILCGDRR